MNQTITEQCWEKDEKGNNILCKKWKKCLGKTWYSQRDIQYCPKQNIWLMSKLIDYYDGHFMVIKDIWPLEKYNEDGELIITEKETGYIDLTNVQVSPSSHAPYEKIRQICGELNYRLKRTGMEGRLLLLEVKNNRLELSEEASHALSYVNGWRRKRLDYNSWVKQRRYRSKIVELHPQIRNQGQLL